MFFKAHGVILSMFVICVLMCGTAYSQQFVTDGLIAFWSLDESTINGEDVEDVFAGNNGVINGAPKTVDGVINECMEFDGAGARVEVPKELMVGLESFTIECWFNYVDSANWRWMFGGGPQWNHGVGCCIYSGSNIVRYHLKTNKGEFTDGNGATKLEVGEWYHIAYTYNGEKVISYVNGELDFERAFTGALVIDVTTLAIGAGYFDNSEYFSGMVDEVRLYNRDLDQDEANQNMNVKSNTISVDTSGKLPETWAKIKTSK